MIYRKRKLIFYGNLEKYLEDCTDCEKKIIDVFLKFRTAHWIKLTNIYIASIVGCTKRTVIRSTNKFHKDGFIIKHQENPYSANYFTLNEKLKI